MEMVLSSDQHLNVHDSRVSKQLYPLRTIRLKPKYQN